VPITQGLFTKPRINLTAALGQLTDVVPLPSANNDTVFFPVIYLLLDD